MNTITLTGKVTALEWVKTGCLSVKVMTGSWGRTRAGIKTETEVPFVVWFWQGQASAVSRPSSEDARVERGVLMIIMMWVP